MIVGIGLDVVDLGRMAQLLERHGDAFVRRVCLDGEARISGGAATGMTTGATTGTTTGAKNGAARAAHVGGLFAAKEAAMKALGTGWAAGVSFRQIEVVREPSGAPGLRLHGEAQRRARKLGVERAHLTISHDGKTAAAVVVLERAPEGELNGVIGETTAEGGNRSVESAGAADKLRFLLLSLAVLALDQWTKWLVETRIELHRSIEVVPGLFHVSHVRNTGVAFGLFAAHGAAAATWLLTLAVTAVLTGVLWYFWRTPATDRLLLTALALVLGGAVGNLIDRATTGAVTDFLAVFIGEFRWPDFNVADSAISIGITLLLFDSFRTRAVRSPAPEAS